MSIEKMVDHFSGLILEVLKIEKNETEKKNQYFVTVYDRATEEIIDDGSCFTNRQEAFIYYDENFRSYPDESNRN